MKIAILGTRGIPNNYGGFEQLAEYLSVDLADKGHEVTVYNPSDHPYENNSYHEVRIIKIFSNEKIFGFLNSFIFDFLCLYRASKNNYDIILQLGYHPSSIFYYFYKLMKPSDKIITNMAGMEWKRSKWGILTQKFIKYCEKKAVFNSDAIISDNLGIQDYYIKTYNKKSYYVAYGAEPFLNPNSNVLHKYSISENNYFLLIARFQKDNNIEMILDGYVLSRQEVPFLVIGSFQNKFGSYLIKKYKNKNIHFIGGVYDYAELCSLRYYCSLYFHGHSCGGTNPSLLEAMASSTYIASYDNIFNKNVLKDNAVYFSESKEIAYIINNLELVVNENQKKENLEKIMSQYRWEEICNNYEFIFKDIMKIN